jgi:hypothetical protein
VGAPQDRGVVRYRPGDSVGSSPIDAAYHIGYGMDLSEMVILFLIGILFAVVFLITRSVLILRPVFQPMAHLLMLVEDRLTLPFLDIMKG